MLNQATALQGANQHFTIGDGIGENVIFAATAPIPLR